MRKKIERKPNGIKKKAKNPANHNPGSLRLTSAYGTVNPKLDIPLAKCGSASTRYPQEGRTIPCPCNLPSCGWIDRGNGCQNSEFAAPTCSKTPETPSLSSRPRGFWGWREGFLRSWCGWCPPPAWVDQKAAVNGRCRWSPAGEMQSTPRLWWW